MDSKRLSSSMSRSSRMWFYFYSAPPSSDDLICLPQRLSIYRNGLTHQTQVELMGKLYLAFRSLYRFLQENLDFMRAQNHFAKLSRKSVEKVSITRY